MHLRRRAFLISAVLAAFAVIPTGVTAADPTPPPVPTDEVLVRYADDVTAVQRRAVGTAHDLEVVSTSADGRTQVVVGDGVSPATVRRELKADPRVVAVAPNYQRELADEITDEDLFASEWGLFNSGQTLSGTRTQTGIADVDIDGLEALRITHGLPGIVVAVIDDGVDFSHPDLAGRKWTNPGEIPGNGVDDDGNGLRDDVNGWDFCNNNASVYDAGQGGHGTHVAGTIAASLNGTGVVGVAPGIRIMALKFIGGGACGTDEMAVNAIDYAGSFGVPIINASWGGPGASAVLDAAIADAGALFVAAAGNDGLDLNQPGVSFYPAESTVANVVSVAAIDQRGARANFSNYGATTVDISAPGTNILSTYPGGYAWSDGTSMAAPHVAGVAALVASVAEGPVSHGLLKSRILSRGTALASMAGRTVTGYLVNASRAIEVSGPTALPVYHHGINAGTVVGSTLSTKIYWGAATDDVSGVASYVVRRRIGSGPWTVIANAVPNRSLTVPMTLVSPAQFAIAARDGVGNVGAQAESPAVTATLYEDGTSLAHYAGRWVNTTSSTASHRNLHTATQAGASVEFRRSAARAISIVGRQGPTSGQARIYVDGVLASTIDLRSTTAKSRVVLFSRSWSTPGTHSVRLVVVGTSGRPRVDVDGFAVIR